MMLWHRVTVTAIVIALVLSGCRTEPEKRYDLKGRVVSMDKEHRQVTLAHEKIPGFMDAMTMPFNVHDDWAIDVLAPGQSVDATLVVAGDRSWIEIRNIRKAGQSSAVSEISGPKTGDEVPDFALLNQDNQPVHLHQFRGRPLLLTFIYTRCPLPDYCPRTSRNFSDIYQALRLKPASAQKPLLLTVSFDTQNDTPAVLREYAGRYMHPVNFKDWAFATGTEEEIKKITTYFGLNYWPESGQISHNLVTVLIAPDGKVVQLYQGNQWKPAEVLAIIKE
jgi:protein SCO1